jgi:hypothetical protein
VPFGNMPEAAVVNQVLSGERPNFLSPEMPAAVRDVVKACWSADAKARPSAGKVAFILTQLSKKVRRTGASREDDVEKSEALRQKQCFGLTEPINTIFSVNALTESFWKVFGREAKQEQREPSHQQLVRQKIQQKIESFNKERSKQAICVEDEIAEEAVRVVLPLGRVWTRSELARTVVSVCVWTFD